jgi:hypothetical protein
MRNPEEYRAKISAIIISYIGLTIAILIFSCEKEERKNWICYQHATIYRDDKCKCDSIPVSVLPYRLDNLDQYQVSDTIDKYTFSSWMQMPGLKDSVYVVSTMNCRVRICVK